MILFDESAAGLSDFAKGREVRDALWVLSEEAKGDMDIFWRDQNRKDYDEAGATRDALGVAMTLLDIAFPTDMNGDKI